MRSCLIATALARRLEVPESEVADTYYTALLMHAKLADAIDPADVHTTGAPGTPHLTHPGDYLATVTDSSRDRPGARSRPVGRWVSQPRPARRRQL